MTLCDTTGSVARSVHPEGAGIDIVRICCIKCAGHQLTLRDAQAALDGTLLVLCSKLSSQPQIATAYTKQAPIRAKLHADLQAALKPLQVCHACLNPCLAPFRSA